MTVRFQVVSLAAHSHTFLLLCFLVVGIHALRNSVDVIRVVFYVDTCTGSFLDPTDEPV